MMGETENISLFKSGAEAFCFSICAGASEGLKTWLGLFLKAYNYLKLSEKLKIIEENYVKI